jgi:hypothetical protein
MRALLSHTAVGLLLSLVAGQARADAAHPVQFQAEPGPMSLYVRAPEGGVTAVHGGRYRKLCDGSCALELPPRRYDFALSIPGAAPRATQEPVRVTGPGRLEGAWVSRSALRDLGVGLLIGGPVAGIVVGLATYDRWEGCGVSGTGEGSCEEPDNTLSLVAFTSLTLGGIIGGIVLLAQRDQAMIRFVPGASPVARPAPGDPRAEQMMLPGFRFEGRF